MSQETLTLEFDDASAPMRKATIQEVVMRRFGGVGPDQPRIRKITVEYDDPRPGVDRPDPVNELPPEEPENVRFPKRADPDIPPDDAWDV